MIKVDKSLAYQVVDLIVQRDPHHYDMKNSMTRFSERYHFILAKKVRVNQSDKLLLKELLKRAILMHMGLK